MVIMKNLRCTGSIPLKVNKFVKTADKKREEKKFAS